MTTTILGQADAQVTGLPAIIIILVILGIFVAGLFFIIRAIIRKARK